MITLLDMQILIDRNSLLDTLAKQRWDEPKHKRTIMRSMQLVMGQPKVDAVPVVRCADCSHMDTNGFQKGMLYCGRFHHVTYGGDYCSAGERTARND